MYDEFQPGYDWEELIEKDLEKDLADTGRPSTQGDPEAQPPDDGDD